MDYLLILLQELEELVRTLNAYRAVTGLVFFLRTLCDQNITGELLAHQAPEREVLQQVLGSDLMAVGNAVLFLQQLAHQDEVLGGQRLRYSGAIVLLEPLIEVILAQKRFENILLFRVVGLVVADHLLPPLLDSFFFIFVQPLARNGELADIVGLALLKAYLAVGHEPHFLQQTAHL